MVSKRALEELRKIQEKQERRARDIAERYNKLHEKYIKILYREDNMKK